MLEILAIRYYHGTVTIWDAQSGESILSWVVYGDRVTSLCSHSYDLLASGYWDGTIILHGLESFESGNLLKLGVGGCAVLLLCYLHDNSLGCEDGNITIWDVRNIGNSRNLSGHKGGVSSLCVSSTFRMVEWFL